MEVFHPLQTEFLRDHLFYIKNNRVVCKRCFSKRHSFQQTLPIVELGELVDLCGAELGNTPGKPKSQILDADIV